MRIALATRSLTRGGAQVQLFNLATGLARRGHAVTVVVLYEGGALHSELERAGIDVICLEKRRRWDVLMPLVRYLAITRHARFNVIYSFLPLENLFSLVVARYSGAALVWGLRGAAQDVKQFGYASQFLYWAQRRLMSAPDRVISNSVAALLEIGVVPGGRFAVVPNGLDVARFRPDPTARSRVRAELRVSDDQLLVGCVARLDSIKDHSTLLRAVALVAARRPDIKVAIVGSGPSDYQASLMRIAQVLGMEETVSWLGARSDVERLMNGFDVYVSASQAEGFSNSLAEAMACGVVPVVTDVGDSAFVVGTHGAVVPTKRPDLLADAVLTWLERDTPELRLARRQRIVNEFGIERMIESSLDTLSAAAR